MPPTYRIIAGRKVAKNNSKNIELTGQAFSNAVKLMTSAMQLTAGFRPEHNEAKTHRNNLLPLYKFCAEHAALAFEEEFIAELMFQIKIEKFDFVNGVVAVGFVYEHASVKINYTLVFFAHLAPFSEKWPALVEANGGGQSTRNSWMFV